MLGEGSPGDDLTQNILLSLTATRVGMGTAAEQFLGLNVLLVLQQKKGVDFVMEKRNILVNFLFFSLFQRPLSVTVIRGGRRVHVGLTPKRWSGKGLLG